MTHEYDQKEILLTIGVPVYNAETTIREVINSLVKDLTISYEIIVSDNCSEDRTFEIIKSLLSAGAPISVYQHSSNKGAPSNWNFVLSKARGKYFAWVSADDERDENYFEPLIEALERDPQAVLAVPQVVISSRELNCTIGRVFYYHATRSMSFVRRVYLSATAFPAVGIYGVYRTKDLQETQGIGRIPGSDLSMIEELSWRGHFVYCACSVFKYNCRMKWNTREDDYKFFSGDSKDSKIPTSLSLAFDISSRLLRSKIARRNKMLVFFVLSVLSLRKFISVLIRDFSLFIVKKFEDPNLICKFYFKYVKNPYMIAEDIDVFFERELQPRFKVDLTKHKEFFYAAIINDKKSM